MKHEVGNPATTAEVSAVGTKVDDLRKQFEGVFAKSPPEIGWKTESALDDLQYDLDRARSDLRLFEQFCGSLDARLRRQALISREEIGGLQVEIATLRPELTVRVALLREDASAFGKRIAGIRERIERVRKEISDLNKARTERQNARLNTGMGFLFGTMAIAAVVFVAIAIAEAIRG